LLVDFLQKKYADQHIDLIVAGLAPSLDFALQHRQKIFPGVPIVFIGLDEEEVRERTLPPDVIGAPIKMDVTVRSTWPFDSSPRPGGSSSSSAARASMRAGKAPCGSCSGRTKASWSLRTCPDYRWTIC
jgi:hypothetical protein